MSWYLDYSVVEVKNCCMDVDCGGWVCKLYKLQWEFRSYRANDQTLEAFFKDGTMLHISLFWLVDGHTNCANQRKKNVARLQNNQP